MLTFGVLYSSEIPQSYSKAYYEIPVKYMQCWWQVIWQIYGPIFSSLLFLTLIMMCIAASCAEEGIRGRHARTALGLAGRK